MLDYDIKAMYEDMEIRLIKSMKRNLKRHLAEEDEMGFEFPQWQAMKLKELKRYQNQNKEIIGSEVKGYGTRVSKFLKSELKEGSQNAIRQYKEAMGIAYRGNKNLNKTFFKVNDKKVNALINSVNGDLSEANKAILRKTNDQYRQIIHKAQMYVANGTMTPAQAIDMANKDFLRAGLNVIEYKDGRRVNIASYSQMAVRTAGQRATLTGEGEFRKKYHQPLVKVTTHGTSCPLCEKWQGKILIDDVYGGGTQEDGKYTLLSEAMKQGFLHPNCRHGLETYLPELDDIDNADGKDVSDDAYQDDLNYIANKIKEYTRLEIGSIDKDNIEQYKEKKEEWQNKKTVVEETQGTVLELLKKGVLCDNNLLGSISDELLRDNLSKVNELMEKYPVIKSHAKKKGMKISVWNRKSNVRAKTKYNPLSINFNKYKYNADDFIKEEIHWSSIGWNMPMDNKYASTYTTAHEMGHVLEHILIMQKSPKTNKEYYEIADIFAQIIHGIAKKNNPNFDLSKALSKYGRTNSREFFAEVFANLESGKPNELALAMKEFLEKRGATNAN